MSTIKVDTIQKTNGSAPELSDLGVTTGYEHHWWAYNGSQGLSADSVDVLDSFTTLHNVSSTYHNYYKQLGSTSFTESSGVFTFPRTGTWKIDFVLNVQDNDASSRHLNAIIDISNDSGNNYVQFYGGYGAFIYVTSNTYAQVHATRLVNVTDTSTFRCRLKGLSNTALDVVRTYPNTAFTNVIFERVSDAQ